MFEILLSLCLAGAPMDCHVERRPGGGSYGACVAEAERLRRAASEVPQEWPCVPAATDPAFRVTEIAPGVFVHKGRHEEAGPGNLGDTANLGFIIGGKAVAVIDAGGSAAVARALLAAVRERTDLPVEWVILTHMHPDHSLGASVFADAGAKVVGHRKLAAALAARAGQYVEANDRLIGAGFAGTAALGPVAVAPARIDLGGRVIAIEQHATAHTDNDVTILDERTGTWFLGDLLFIDHLPALDGSLVGWIGLMRDLAPRSAARVVPGHGPVAADWPDSAAPMRGYLDSLAGEVRAAVAAGTPMLDAIAAAEAEAGGLRWLMGPLFHPRNVSAAYKELEWE